MGALILKGLQYSQTRHLARYILDGQEVHIRRCSYEDIPVHAERVSSFWENPDMNIQSMNQAVNKGTAWKLGDLCFLYAVPYEKRLCGIAFWCKLKIHAVLGYMFIRDHTKYEHIYWNPHKMRITPLSFMLDNRTIADYWDGAEFIGMKIPSTQMELVRRKQLLKHEFKEV